MYITTETRDTLRTWYFTERETLRAGALVNAGKGKRINVRSLGARDRRLHYAFWKRVKAFIDTQCSLTGRINDDVAADFSQHLAVLDAATVSTFAAAKACNRGFLSDEMVLRQHYAQPAGIESVSLRPFLMRWFQLHFVPGQRSAFSQVRAFARLVAHGRVFQSIPISSLYLALHAESHERLSLLQTLLSTIRSADPRHWREGIRLITYNHMLRKSSHQDGINPKRMISIVLSNLPKLPAREYSTLADLLESRWVTVDRHTRRTVVRWLRRRIRQPSEGR